MRTITVKGTGTASVKPDFVVLTLSLETLDLEYKCAMERAAEKIREINLALEGAGFEKEAVKTTDFNVRTDYESKKDRNGNYYRVFNGYVVRHQLKVSFDFDTKVLSRALSEISSLVANPELSVRFTVKDATAVNEALLESAAQNARRKAEILCTSSGAKLGNLINIDYNWGEINIYSRTNYDMDDCCMKAMEVAPMDIEPDDIDSSDGATFVWEIV